MEMIIPSVSNKNEDNGVLKFTLSNVNVSFANAIRRIILSEIPCIVFKTTPYEENKCIIYTNTSRLNNEIIKQRLSCIPIHIDDLAFPINDYVLEVNEKNDTDTIKIITTGDFKIKNIKTEKYLSREAVNKIFPSDNLSNDYIDFVRLRPKLSDDIDGEQLFLECALSITNAKENGMFNVVSCSTYSNTLDPFENKKVWDEKEKQLRQEGQTIEEIEYLKKDWNSLQAYRYFKPNSFDFMIETVGVFENETIVIKACNIMIQKIETFKQNILERYETIIFENEDVVIENCYDIKLENEDYTLGKVIEYMLYKDEYLEAGHLSFCAFRKPHPHINESFIRIAGIITSDSEKKPYLQNKGIVVDMVVNACNIAINVYTQILTFFK
jgi:DNA-directed RNA polymerase II subunit RPB3